MGNVVDLAMWRQRNRRDEVMRERTEAQEAAMVKRVQDEFVKLGTCTREDYSMPFHGVAAGVGPYPAACVVPMRLLRAATFDAAAGREVTCFGTPIDDWRLVDDSGLGVAVAMWVAHSTQWTSIELVENPATPLGWQLAAFSHGDHEFLAASAKEAIGRLISEDGVLKAEFAVLAMAGIFREQGIPFPRDVVQRVDAWIQATTTAPRI